VNVHFINKVHHICTVAQHVIQCNTLQNVKKLRGILVAKITKQQTINRLNYGALYLPDCTLA